MNQKGIQKNYKNNKSNPIFNYDKEINKREKDNKMKKKIKQSKIDNSRDSVNAENNEYFIGMNDNKTTYTKNQKNHIMKNKLELKEKKREKEIENKKRKKLKELNKKLVKKQKKKQKEIRKIEKNEAKKRKQEAIKNLNPKEKRRRKIRKATIKYSFILILFIFAIALFLLSPVFYVKNIEIDGNSKVSNEEIEALLQINSETNIFEESNKKVNENLKENKYIEKVNVKKVLPATLKISITERDVVYLLEYANSFAYTDEKGNILEISTKDIDGKTKILGYTTKNLNEQNILEDEDIKKLKSVKAILQSAEQFKIKDKITSINIADENDYQVYMKEENKIIHLGTAENIDTKMIYVKAIIEKEKGNDGEIFVNMDLNKKQPFFRQNV